MMGLRPWGDNARAAAYAARAEREVLGRIASASDGGQQSVLERVRDTVRLPASSGIPSFNTPDRVERARADYDRAFRKWYDGVEKTSTGIAAFHGLVAALGGAAAGASGAYRQVSGVRPVVGTSRAFGTAGRYLTGKPPLYDSEGVLSGFAKVGRRPYPRAFNQPMRAPILKAGSVSAPGRIGKMIDPATGRVVGRVRYTPEDDSEQGWFKGMRFDDRVRETGVMEQYERDMTRAYDAGRAAALHSEFADIGTGLKAAGLLGGTELAEAFRDGWDVGKGEAPMMDSGAYNAGVTAYREGAALPDAVQNAGLIPRTEAYDAFQKGWLDASGIADPAESVEDISGDYDLDALAYAAGLAAYEIGLSIVDAAREMGIVPRTSAYADLEKGYYDAAGVVGGHEAGPDAVMEAEPAGYGEWLDEVDATFAADMAARGLDPQGYPLEEYESVWDKFYPDLASAEQGGRDAFKNGYAVGEVPYALKEGTAKWDAFRRGYDEEQAAFERGKNLEALHLGLLGVTEDAREEHARRMSDLDAAWHAELEAMGGKLEGGRIIRKAATDYGASVSLGRELMNAVKSKTARDAARALGVLSGQWGVNSDIVNKLPPELLGEFEKGLADGKRGYDYGIRPPVDRAAVVRRANAVIASGAMDPEDPIGGYWPEHLSPRNQELWARQAAEGGKGKYGNGTVELLRASMDWLGTAMADNDREGMNAALSYMADTLAAIQEDGRGIARMRNGDSEEAGDEEIDTAMPEFDEDGNEVGGESPFYEDSYADPNAVPPWDFERQGWDLFGGMKNRALRFVAAAENGRARLAARTGNRWSNAARAASAAVRLAKYGSMMGLKPWGAAARTAAALARAKGGGRTASHASVRGGRRRPVGGGGRLRGGAGVGKAHADTKRRGEESVPVEYADAVESYAENGIDGMRHEERIAIYDEIRERERKGGKLTDQDKEFLREFEDFLDREIQRGSSDPDKEGLNIGYIPLRFGAGAPDGEPAARAEKERRDAEADARKERAKKGFQGGAREEILGGKVDSTYYDDYIAGAKADGNGDLVRQLRRAKNEARKREVRERLQGARAGRAGERPGQSDVYGRMKAGVGGSRFGGFSKSPYEKMKARAGITGERKLVRDNAGTVWDFRKPGGGWESRGGTPVSQGHFYNPSDGKFYDRNGRVVGDAPKTPREGAVFYGGKWFDAKTGKTISGGADV